MLCSYDRNIASKQLTDDHGCKVTDTYIPKVNSKLLMTHGNGAIDNRNNVTVNWTPTRLAAARVGCWADFSFACITINRATN